MFNLLPAVTDNLFGIFGDKSKTATAKTAAHESISIMTWNILAPMWVDVNSLKAGGVVDLNLLNKDVRLRLIVQQILQTNADVVTLQEVQENVYSEITHSISMVYEPVAFAPNKKDYWRSYLPDGEEYRQNGVAMFCKKNKFKLTARNSFVTSDNGSVGLAAVLHVIKSMDESKHKNTRTSEPIIVITFHLETGFTAEESAKRVEQGTAVMDEADRITKIISRQFHEIKPVVILTGDINSQAPFPGYLNFKKRGYLDVVEEVGDATKHTFFYPAEVALPTGLTNGSSLDHVLVRADDMERIRLFSAKIPNIKSDELLEEAYVDRVMKLMMQELRLTKTSEYMRIVRCKVFPALFNMTVDDLDYDEDVNRVLRLGSDHLPLTVELSL